MHNVAYNCIKDEIFQSKKKKRCFSKMKEKKMRKLCRALNLAHQTNGIDPPGNAP